MYSSSSSPKTGKTWPTIPPQNINFNYFNKPRNMSPSLVRNLEKEVITLRREVIDLRIRLSTRADEKLLKRKKLESLTKQLEDATNTIKIMHHIVDNKTQLLKETVVAIEQHEEYQQSQEQDSRSKIAQMESHIRELEESVNRRNQKCLTMDVSSQVDLDLEFSTLSAEPLPKQQLDTQESDLIEHDVELHDQKEAKSDQNITGHAESKVIEHDVELHDQKEAKSDQNNTGHAESKVIEHDVELHDQKEGKSDQNITGHAEVKDHGDASKPRNGATNGNKKHLCVHTDTLLDLTSFLLQELREEVELNKSAKNASKTAMLDVEQTQEAIFTYFLDKINVLSERVRVLEEETN